jgi:preprotein translocase subunit SecB
MSVDVLELHIRANEAPSKRLDLDSADVVIAASNSDYNSENEQVAVRVKAEIGMEEETDSPLSLRVELSGLFRVDSSRFPIEEINGWARSNAPLVLLPYLREHVFSLTSRSGFQPMLLPLVEVPTYRMGGQAEDA